jgi:hypothetical protein
MNFDQNGKAFIDLDPAADKTNIVRILTGTRRDPNPDNSIFVDGKAPRGVVINQNDTRAYTFNYVTRDVTLIDLVNDRPISTVATTQSKGNPVIQYGKELFNSGVGPLDTVQQERQRFRESDRRPHGRLGVDGLCELSREWPDRRRDLAIRIRTTRERFT